jgi:hypothetical protein
MCLASSSRRDSEKPQPTYPEPLQGTNRVSIKNSSMALSVGVSRSLVSQISHTFHLYPLLISVRDGVDPGITPWWKGLTSRTLSPATRFCQRTGRSCSSSKFRFPDFPEWCRVVSFTHRPLLHATPNSWRVGPRKIVCSDGLTLSFPNFTGWR